MVSLKVNGESKKYDGDPEMPLLWYLRDDLKLYGTKYGCGQGLCGACTVHINGVATRSCQTWMSAVEGKEIVTIEGLDPKDEHPLQLAWQHYNVPQCGYCQTGQIMQAASLLKKNPSLNDADIEKEMKGNICRCGTYDRIRQAVKSVSEKRGGNKK